jgi:phytoene synthase
MTHPEGAGDASDEADKLGFWAARQICRRQAQPLYWPAFFLPKPKRDAAFAVIAFCHMTQAAINRPEELDPRLELFQARLHEVYGHRLELPLPQFRTQEQHALHAFARSVHRYQIPQQYFAEFAEGCRMRLTVKRFATWTSLEKYCYDAGGVLGLIGSAVMGLTNTGAAVQAVYMGNAIRLTLILRDVGRHWELGRLHLPLEDMVRFGYREKDLARPVVNDAFVALMKFEIARARELYRMGAEGLCWLGDEGSKLAASTVALRFNGILDAIERQGYDVFTRRAGLTTAQKFRRLPSAWRLARRKHDQPLPARVFGRP